MRKPRGQNHLKEVELSGVLKDQAEPTRQSYGGKVLLAEAPRSKGGWNFLEVLQRGRGACLQGMMVKRTENRVWGIYLSRTYSVIHLLSTYCMPVVHGTSKVPALLELRIW